MPITTRMSCSIISTVSLLSSRRRRTKDGELGGLLRVHAGRRLVEQEQLRFGGERARDLESALVAVREVARGLVLVLPEPCEAEQLARLARAPRPPRP